jgi:uncharacterized glyoxalase superfamily protein PhnB
METVAIAAYISHLRSRTTVATERGATADRRQGSRRAIEQLWVRSEPTTREEADMAANRPVLDQINLVVRDMAAMTEFYRRLGLELAPTPPEWERHHRTAETPAGLDLDFDSQAFAAQWNAGWNAAKTGVVIGFRVTTRDAVDQIYTDLSRAGYAAQQAPYDAFWGARYAIVSDPDGNAVGIMSPIDPEQATSPPEPPI